MYKCKGMQLAKLGREHHPHVCDWVWAIYHEYQLKPIRNAMWNMLRAVNVYEQYVYEGTNELDH